MFKSTLFCKDLFLKTRDVIYTVPALPTFIIPNFALTCWFEKKYYFILNLNQYLVATNQ